MNEKKIEWIPIAEIRVVNPRSRNKIKFQLIVSSIEAVGLKKPITVSRRAIEPDGTRYDLVCGQGRMEAMTALGQSAIPAIVTEASREERYLMSLVEKYCAASTFQPGPGAGSAVAPTSKLQNN